MPAIFLGKGIDVMDLLVTVTTREGKAEFNSTKVGGVGGSVMCCLMGAEGLPLPFSAGPQQMLPLVERALRMCAQHVAPRCAPLCCAVLQDYSFVQTPDLEVETGNSTIIPRRAVPNPHITAWLRGELVWGTLPGMAQVRQGGWVAEGGSGRMGQAWRGGMGCLGLVPARCMSYAGCTVIRLVATAGLASGIPVCRWVLLRPPSFSTTACRWESPARTPLRAARSAPRAWGRSLLLPVNQLTPLLRPALPFLCAEDSIWSIWTGPALADPPCGRYFTLACHLSRAVQRCGLSAVYCCTGPDPVSPVIPEEWPPGAAINSTASELPISSNAAPLVPRPVAMAGGRL